METRDSFVGRLDGVSYFRSHQTESYVVIPPALIITDERGDTWSLGTEYTIDMEFNVIRNDRSTGEFASRIEYRRGHGVRIFGKAGWRVFNGRTFV